MSVNKVLGVETGDITKIDDIESQTIVEVMGISSDFSTVPLGLIIPFNDTSIPSGWERFTSADNKYIVGAGSTYSIGESGGSTSFTLTQGLSSAGSHTGPGGTVPYYIWYEPASSQGAWGNTGAHTHSLTTANYSPECNEILLIKNLSEKSSFPAKGILFSSGSLSGLSNILNNNRFLKSSNTITTSGSSSCLAETSTDGGHTHDHFWYAANAGPTYMSQYHLVSGAHSHDNISIGVTENIKKVQLSAWTNALAEFGVLPNMIGMYESLTPPEGWVLCNGNNGTPDMRDYFIYNVPSGNENPIGVGNNNVTATGSGSAPKTVNHTHDSGTSPRNDPKTGYHSTYSWSHSHSFNVNESASYLPPYYALSFIMKAA